MTPAELRKILDGVSDLDLRIQAGSMASIYHGPAKADAINTALAALPELLETDRLPCLATRAPACGFSWAFMAGSRTGVARVRQGPNGDLTTVVSIATIDKRRRQACRE